MKNWEIPNPFLNEDGVSIEKPEEWSAQQAYLAMIYLITFSKSMS